MRALQTVVVYMQIENSGNSSFTLFISNKLRREFMGYTGIMNVKF